MSDEKSKSHEVVEFAGSGFVALWRGEYVQAAGGGLHYFATERDARKFLELCDAVNGYRRRRRETNRQSLEALPAG